MTTPKTVPDPPEDDEQDARAKLERKHAYLKAETQRLEAILNNWPTSGAPSIIIDNVHIGSPSLPPVKKGQYEGVDISFPVEEYLRERRGHRIPLLRVANDMLLAGVVSKERKYQKDQLWLVVHRLKHMISQRRDLIGRSPDGPLRNIDAERIVIWLAEEPQKKQRKK